MLRAGTLLALGRFTPLWSFALLSMKTSGMQLLAPCKYAEEFRTRPYSTRSPTWLATRNLTMAYAAWRVGNRESNQTHFDIFSLAPHSVNRHRRLTRRSWLMCLGTSPLQDTMIAPGSMPATEACPLRSWTHGCGLPPQA